MFLNCDSSEISTIFSKLKALSSTKCDDINQSNQELDATHTVYTAKLCGYDNELSQILSMTDLGNKYTQPTDKRQKDQELIIIYLTRSSNVTFCMGRTKRCRLLMAILKREEFGRKPMKSRSC